MNITYTVAADLPAMPLKTYLRSKCGISNGLWRRLKWNGIITVNGITVRPTMVSIKPGDIITCQLAEESSIVPSQLPLDIRYEDDYMIIVDKKPGMLVHPTGGDHTNTLGNALKYYYQQSHQDVDFHPVHRLDRNTTGLVLVAKLPQLQNGLTNAYGAKFFHRSYIAVVPGRLTPMNGTIDLPIARHPDSIIQRVCSSDGQPAVTHYHTLSYAHGKSLLWLELETGRTHQIRVHLAAVGHPLLGDDLYGGDTGIIKRQALHATRLIVENPLTKAVLTINSDVPQDIINAYEQ